MSVMGRSGYAAALMHGSTASAIAAKRMRFMATLPSRSPRACRKLYAVHQGVGADNLELQRAANPPSRLPTVTASAGIKVCSSCLHCQGVHPAGGRDDWSHRSMAGCSIHPRLEHRWSCSSESRRRERRPWRPLWWLRRLSRRSALRWRGLSRRAFSPSRFHWRRRLRAAVFPTALLLLPARLLSACLLPARVLPAGNRVRRTATGAGSGSSVLVLLSWVSRLLSLRARVPRRLAAGCASAAAVAIANNARACARLP